MSENYYVKPEALFSRDPSQWVASYGCECSAAGVGFVQAVDKEPLAYTAAVGGLPGLTPEETAILAGILTALAVFLFLLLPILCCLCPLCACCGQGRKKSAVVTSGGGGGHRHANLARSDNESFWSTGSFNKGERMDYENLYGVDMKLPRPWVDNGSHFDSKVHELEDGGWEGVDMTRDEIDAAVRAGHSTDEVVAQTGIVTYAGAGDHGGSGVAYSTMDRGRGAGDEVITEYTTTRRLDMTIGGMSQDEAEGYYAQTYGQGQDPNMTKDNFMRIYHSFRNDMDGRRHT